MFSKSVPAVTESLMACTGVLSRIPRSRWVCGGVAGVLVMLLDWNGSDNPVEVLTKSGRLLSVI